MNEQTKLNHAIEVRWLLLFALPTMEGTFFQNSFAKRGIEVATPNAEERTYIGAKIETELEFGKVLPETQRAFKEIAERIIREERVQTVVLGCPLCRKKYGNTNGKYQEQEGAPLVREFLADTGMTAEQIDRVKPRSRP